MAPAEGRDVLELSRQIVAVGSRQRQQASCTLAKALASSDTSADGGEASAVTRPVRTA